MYWISWQTVYYAVDLLDDIPRRLCNQLKLLADNCNTADLSFPLETNTAEPTAQAENIANLQTKAEKKLHLTPIHSSNGRIFEDNIRLSVIYIPIVQHFHHN